MDAYAKMNLKAERRDRKVRGPKVVVSGLRSTQIAVDTIAKRAKKGGAK